MSLPEHLRLPTRPHAHPDNVVTVGNARFTVLTPALVRVEYAPEAVFEDRASQVVVNRDTARCAFDARRVAVPAAGAADADASAGARSETEGLELDTACLHLSYDGGPFTPQGLSAQVKGGVSNYHSVWRFGLPVEGNLGGTARTLDNVDGECPLEEGLLSRNGITVLDDSRSLLLGGDGRLEPRRTGSLDLYLFAHGRDYPAALRDFYAITGSPPVLPRFALGNWWSRYHRYTADEYDALLDRFDAERLPFSVAVLDMDWHPVDIDPAYGSGWTGYSWNRDLFPDPTAFLAGLHERGLRVTLNVHPADGIRAHEDAYPQLARALGIDPATRAPIAFDPADPDFLAAYLEHVHHPREAEGVDFWWLDWQSGPYSRMPGLDPLWMLNHVHFLDAARPRERPTRPLTFSRYAGPGSHRYPVGFSGDTVVSWASLAFQPRFTATAANIGYGWWSHDIGGHMFGYRDDELATRWVQLGAFSPVLRLHSTFDEFNRKEPWRFGREHAAVMGEYLRLRHRLVPYLHTMNRRAHDLGEPLVRPMYHDHPWEAGAYEVPNQFAFGTCLLVAPVTTPIDRETALAAVDAWLPDGDWLDVRTGLAYSGGRPGSGGRRIRMHRTLRDLPVLARRGAILPLAGGDDEAVGVQNPQLVRVCVVAGGSGEFELAEDRDDDAWALTPMTFDGSDLTIGPVEGHLESVPAGRRYEVEVLGARAVTGALVRLGDSQGSRGSAGSEGSEGSEGSDARVSARESRPGAVVLEIGEVPPGQCARVRLIGDVAAAENDVAARVFEVLDRAQVAFGLKARLRDAIARSADPRDGLLEIAAIDAPESLRAALTEIVLAG